MSRSRLETVVRIRALQEKIARGHVERERSALREHADAVERAKKAVLARSHDHPASPGAFEAQRRMLDAGVRDIGAAERRKDVAGEAVVQSIDEWVEASRKLEGIERLEQRIKKIQRATDGLKEQTEIDDLVVTRWKRPTP